MTDKTKNFCVYLYGDGRAEAYEIPKTRHREGVWHSHNGVCGIHQVDIIANTDIEAIDKAKIMLRKVFRERLERTMPPSLILDRANDIITLSAGQKTIVITSGEVTSTETTTEMENLAHSMLTVVTTALVASCYMMIFAVTFGGRYLDEIKESISKGKVNETTNL